MTIYANFKFIMRDINGLRQRSLFLLVVILSILVIRINMHRRFMFLICFSSEMQTNAYL